MQEMSKTGAGGNLSARDYYDLLAGEYEQQNQFWDNPYDTEVWRLEHDLFIPFLAPAEPLLDLGCGFYPHDGFPARTRIIAGDISFRSLLTARRHLPAQRAIELLHLDVHHLPFKDGAFSQVIAGGELLNHVDYEVVLAEVARVLRHRGVLLVEIGGKWCLDSLWAILDSFLGHRIGYSVTREEALKFFRYPFSDVEVTWEITPKAKFCVTLIAVANLCRALRQVGFSILRTVSTNCISGFVPLPWQQDSDRPIAQALASGLLKVDRIVGRAYPLSHLGGNIFLVCRREAQ